MSFLKNYICYQWKSSQINNNRKGYKSKGLDEHNMLHRFERTRRNALDDTSTVSTNANRSCQKHYYH